MKIDSGAIHDYISLPNLLLCIFSVTVLESSSLVVAVDRSPWFRIHNMAGKNPTNINMVVLASHATQSIS